MTLYLNNTGLMWELAPRHNALLVFAEHRYYGESKPFSLEDLRSNMGYLTSEQAMADYADLIWDLKKKELKDLSVPVIGFGGSYGGMLATWFRIKYPHLLDGAIAASAPIWSFYGEDPPYDAGGFSAAVSWDASPEGGSAPACVPNARATWATLFDWGVTKEGRARIAESMRLCGSSTDALPNKESVRELAEWAMDAWAYLAMGDYPYSSTYILNGEATLPAYPIRAACEHLKDPDLEGDALLRGMASAVGLFFNATGSLECFDFGASAGNATAEDATFWDFQYCSEQFMPQSSDGIRDMFWDVPLDPKSEMKRCEEEWGVTPSKYKATIEWGGRRIESASNIVFSNGGRDPWGAGGVLHTLSDTLVAVHIPEGAHHLDLMFSNEKDPESVIMAREIEEENITKWIKDARDRSEQLQQVQAVKLPSTKGRKELKEGLFKGRGGLGMMKEVSNIA